MAPAETCISEDVPRLCHLDELARYRGLVSDVQDILIRSNMTPTTFAHRISMKSQILDQWLDGVIGSQQLDEFNDAVTAGLNLISLGQESLNHPKRLGCLPEVIADPDYSDLQLKTNDPRESYERSRPTYFSPTTSNCEPLSTHLKSADGGQTSADVGLPAANQSRSFQKPRTALCRANYESRSRSPSHKRHRKPETGKCRGSRKKRRDRSRSTTRSRSPGFRPCSRAKSRSRRSRCFDSRDTTRGSGIRHDARRECHMNCHNYETPNVPCSQQPNEGTREWSDARESSFAAQKQNCFDLVESQRKEAGTQENFESDDSHADAGPWPLIALHAGTRSESAALFETYCTPSPSSGQSPKIIQPDPSDPSDSDLRTRGPAGPSKSPREELTDQINLGRRLVVFLVDEQKLSKAVLKLIPALEQRQGTGSASFQVVIGSCGWSTKGWSACRDPSVLFYDESELRDSMQFRDLTTAVRDLNCCINKFICPQVATDKPVQPIQNQSSAPKRAVDVAKSKVAGSEVKRSNSRISPAVETDPVPAQAASVTNANRVCLQFTVDHLANTSQPAALEPNLCYRDNSKCLAAKFEIVQTSLCESRTAGNTYITQTALDSIDSYPPLWLGRPLDSEDSVAEPIDWVTSEWYYRSELNEMNQSSAYLEPIEVCLKPLSIHGPFPLRRISAWHATGYFPAETLIQRGPDGDGSLMDVLLAAVRYVDERFKREIAARAPAEMKPLNTRDRYQELAVCPTQNEDAHAKTIPIEPKQHKEVKFDLVEEPEHSLIPEHSNERLTRSEARTFLLNSSAGQVLLVKVKKMLKPAYCSKQISRAMFKDIVSNVTQRWMTIYYQQQNESEIEIEHFEQKYHLDIQQEIEESVGECIRRPASTIDDIQQEVEQSIVEMTTELRRSDLTSRVPAPVYNLCFQSPGSRAELSQDELSTPKTPAAVAVAPLDELKSDCTPLTTRSACPGTNDKPSKVRGPKRVVTWIPCQKSQTEQAKPVRLSAPATPHATSKPVEDLALSILRHSQPASHAVSRIDSRSDECTSRASKGLPITQQANPHCQKNERTVAINTQSQPATIHNARTVTICKAAPTMPTRDQRTITISTHNNNAWRSAFDSSGKHELTVCKPMPTACHQRIVIVDSASSPSGRSSKRKHVHEDNQYALTRTVKSNWLI